METFKCCEFFTLIERVNILEWNKKIVKKVKEIVYIENYNLPNILIITIS